MNDLRRNYTALVTWTDPTAVDKNVDPQPVISCTPASGSEFNIGIHDVVCEAVDESGNNDTCSFDVTGRFEAK